MRNFQTCLKSYDIHFVIRTESSENHRKVEKSNPVLFKKLKKILDDIMDHPRSGIGHPEPLIGGGDTMYSRRISAQNRIIYEINDERIIVLIIEIEGHYDDK